MRKSLQLIAIVILTFLLCFVTSLLLELEIITAAWIRIALVYLLILLELALGAVMFYLAASDLQGPDR